jgi:hypothetical protein
VLNIELVDGLWHSIRVKDPVAGKLKVDHDDGDGASGDIKLPAAITAGHIRMVNSTSGSLGRCLLLTELTSLAEEVQHTNGTAANRKAVYPTVTLRFAVIAAGFWLWQSGAPFLVKLASGAPTHFAAVKIEDLGHRLTAPLHDYLLHHAPAAAAVHDAQVLLSNALVGGWMAASIFGPSVRPCLAVTIALGLRAFLQALTPFIATCGEMIVTEVRVWSLFSLRVTSVSFLCPHLILATVTLLECLSNGRRKGRFTVPILLSLLPVVFQAGAALALRANWSIDLALAMGLTFIAAHAADGMAPGLDVIQSL